MEKLEQLPVEKLTIHTIRTLAMDAVQKANSGHPGTPMALAPLVYVIFKQFLKFNPRNPQWLNRDRFVLSNGHASMLQYAILYLTGYDLNLEDLKNFRQLHSKTPGHPEYGLTAGVETTTGPLGQGFMTAVGLAMAEAHLAAVFNREDHKIIDHFTYVICSDGDLMEGGSHEAASLAGHFGLGKLIYIYDDNLITIEGKTEITYSDQVAKRFEAYNWHVQDIGKNANNTNAIATALETARNITDKPSLIILRSHIGYGAPNMQDTPEAHGSPLGDEEIKLTKRYYGWPEEAKFLVPEKALKHMRESEQQGKKWETEWESTFRDYKKTYPDLAKQLEDSLSFKFAPHWDNNLPVFDPSDKPVATRSVSGKIINHFADKVPWLVGGSADLAPSTKTLINSSGYFGRGQWQNRNVAWGIRELGMCAASSGITLHGGLRAFAATFFVFTDYARSAIRLAALMKIPVIYVMTHDSIGLGEDGPTHQPMEHLASLRAMPNLTVIRPADANETVYAWRTALVHSAGPTMLVLSRQNLPILDQKIYGNAENLEKGAYILAKENGDMPEAIIIGTGSEVHIALEAKKLLDKKRIDVRVVSIPSWELFREQSPEYREKILPSKISRRLAIEAGSTLGWSEWVGEAGIVMGIDHFGVSAPYKEIYQDFGLTADKIVEHITGKF